MIQTSTRPEFRRKLRILKKMRDSAARQGNEEMRIQIDGRMVALYQQRFGQAWPIKGSATQ